MSLYTQTISAFARQVFPTGTSQSAQFLGVRQRVFGDELGLFLNATTDTQEPVSLRTGAAATKMSISPVGGDAKLTLFMVDDFSAEAKENLLEAYDVENFTLVGAEVNDRFEVRIRGGLEGEGYLFDPFEGLTVAGEFCLGRFAAWSVFGPALR